MTTSSVVPVVDLSTLTSLFRCPDGSAAPMRGKLLMVVGTAGIEAPHPIYAAARAGGWSYTELCHLLSEHMVMECAAQRHTDLSQDDQPQATLVVELDAMEDDQTDSAGTTLLVLARNFPVLVVGTGFPDTASHQYADYAAGVDEQGLPVVLKNRYQITLA